MKTIKVDWEQLYPDWNEATAFSVRVIRNLLQIDIVEKAYLFSARRVPEIGPHGPIL